MRVSIPGLFCEEMRCHSEHPIAVILLVSTPYQWPRVTSTKSAGSLEASVCPFFPEHLTWWEAPLCADFGLLLSATHLFLFLFHFHISSPMLIDEENVANIRLRVSHGTCISSLEWDPSSCIAMNAV